MEIEVDVEDEESSTLRRRMDGFGISSRIGDLTAGIELFTKCLAFPVSSINTEHD